MSIHRSFLGLRIQTNNFSSMSRILLGKDPSSLPSTLTKKLDPNALSLIDKRPISLRFRVSSLIELCQLYQAALVSRLAVLENDGGLNKEHMIHNEIIGAMCAAERYDDAFALYQFFDSESKLGHSAVSFNHVVKAHCDQNRVDEALKLCHPCRGYFRKDVDTFRSLAKGLVNTGRIYEAVGLIKYIRLYDSVVYSYLIRGFMDLGNHDKAYELFDDFNNKTEPDFTDGRNKILIWPSRTDGQNRRAVVDATFVDYWLKQGEDEKAMEIYRSLIIRKGELVCAATGNTLLEILLQNGKQTEAWDLFNAMITNSKNFDRETFGIMVNACFKLGHFKEALETFKRLEFTRSSSCYANIIAQFCERGMMSEAQDLFVEICSDQYLSPDVPTFRSMINGYAKAGRVDEAIVMLKKMVDATLLKFAVHESH
ncbi:hypothetical protein ARALYDRAFT_898464 [Arabidopsis lyrata subsp. lyrata]|uniref:Pentatricopeptide repeat-containing protein n=1 Tax=Arabidopsis lyrata subsp. lyrata TaxID=81972 RepID=D7LB02_ARALL|nr:pentatricopeptide repeat-containing protein At3g60960, mitochondrial [Arabidopsis lyrata subsp. lyrata]EFH61636.1 hypothetical protein ARALYDRAFT_898464 [Arabidopsis lyrata subsp. lyrata]|eukprot:XP_002885377.1 pentatricopeptide repeat-containing protein At3g60960, mitochondrial [Arabidopsis lyrata subsp. lyrata]